MVNWFLEGKEPSGYLVFFDIPGIQTFITASRRSLDYWASSMIISYLVIKTFEELIERIGPDIFISPSMRHNPLLRILLFYDILPRNITSKNILENIRLITSSYWSYLAEKSLVLQPVMPGTALCVLPSSEKIRDLGLDLSSEDAVRRYIINRFYKCWRHLVDIILGSADIDGALDKNVMKDFAKVIEISECSPFATPRIVVMDIGELYYEYLQKYSNVIVRILESFKNDINNFDKACEEFKRKMFYHILFNYIIREKLLKNSIRSENVLTLGKYISYIDRLYEDRVSSDRNVDLRYCSMCRKYFSLPFYGNVSGTRDIVREEYRSHIRDNERLCHICLLKRLFYKRYARPTYGDTVKPIPSIHLISNKFIFDLIRNSSEELRKHLHESGDSVVAKICDIICEEGAHKLCIGLLKGLLSGIFSFESCVEDLYKDYEDFVYSFEYYRYGDTLASARRTISSITSAFIRSVDNVEDVKRKIRDDIRSILCIGSYRLDDPICDAVLNRVIARAKSYYAIVKGDGDSIGNIIFGRIFAGNSKKGDLITFEEYFQNIMDRVCPQSNYDEKCKEGFGRLVCILRELKNALEECSKAELDSIILSPTYHSVLSASLMMTSLKDIKTCEDCHCYVIYAGGDDVAALCPVETTLKMVYETRRNYQALNESIRYFHRIRNGASVMPTLTRFGRSYGVRFAHILDPMQLEIEKCSHVLEKFAKKSTWVDYDSGIEYSKDTVAFSYGRGGEVSMENVCKVPLKPEWNVFEIVSQLFTYIAARILSRNLPYDVERYLSALATIRDVQYDRDVLDSLTGVVRYIIERNVLVKEGIKNIHVKDLLENVDRLRKLCCIVEKGEDAVKPLLMHVMRLITMLITSVT